MVVSGLALAAAYLLTTATHELAHALVAAAYGLDPVWHGDQTPPHLPGTTGQETAIVLAGPVYGGITGSLVLALTARIRGYLGLLLNWLGLLSVAGFFGYLLSGVFAPDGDIAKALRLQQAPPWAGWLGFVLGLAGLLGLARVAAIRLVALAPPGWSPAQALRALGLLAVPIAGALLLAGGIPVGPPLISQLIILALVLTGALIFHRGIFRRGIFRRGRHPALLTAPIRLVPPAVVFLALALGEWLILRPGLPL